MKPLKNIEDSIMDNLDSLDNKELVLAIVAMQHLYNENSFNFGADIFITTVSSLSGYVIDTMICKVAFAAFAVTFATRFIIDTVDKYKISKFKNMLVEELVNRFETPQMAYLETAELITSLTREEIIGYLEDIGCEINNVK